MSNGDDVPEACCAAGICCDMPKQLAALTKIIKHASPNVTSYDAQAIAVDLLAHFDLLPKGLITPLIKYVQAHPYD